MKIQKVPILLISVLIISGCTQQEEEPSPSPTENAEPSESTPIAIMPTTTPTETEEQSPTTPTPMDIETQSPTPFTVTRIVSTPYKDSCPSGYKTFYCLDGSYCATDSQKPCTTGSDCPEGEYCKSEDGKNWFCTGGWCGCSFINPENPDVVCRD